MQIDIPKPEELKLASKARDAGFDTVEAFVAEHVLALAHYGPEEFAPLSEGELSASLAMCDEGMAQLDRGEGLSVDEALRQSLAELRAPRS